MELRWHHWLVALTIAAVVHAVILARVGWTRAASTPEPRQDRMMVAIEAGHEADELAEFAAPPSLVREAAPQDESRPAEPELLPLDVQLPPFAAGVAPSALEAPLSPQALESSLRPTQSADAVVPQPPAPTPTAPPREATAQADPAQPLAPQEDWVAVGPAPPAEVVTRSGAEAAPDAPVTASGLVSPPTEPLTTAPDAGAMPPDTALDATEAMPQTTLPAQPALDPGPAAADAAASGFSTPADDAPALAPGAVVRSDPAQAVARITKQLEANLSGPNENVRSAEAPAPMIAQTVDLELTPIVPITVRAPLDHTPAGRVAMSEPPTAVVHPPDSPTQRASDAPLESRPQPVPELAAVAPQESVIARPATPRLKQRDVNIREVVADYAAVLKTWVGQHMSYPVQARLRGIEGTVVVRLVMSRDGHVLSYQLERTSGHRELDQEAINTIRRASPFPPLPPEMEQIELKLRLPLVFSVRNFEARRTVPPIYLD